MSNNLLCAIKKHIKNKQIRMNEIDIEDIIDIESSNKDKNIKKMQKNKISKTFNEKRRRQKNAKKCNFEKNRRKIKTSEKCKKMQF